MSDPGQPRLTLVSVLRGTWPGFESLASSLLTVVHAGTHERALHSGL
jgi:hypothetical protein